MASNLIEAGQEFDRFVGSYVREYARLELILRMAMKKHSGLDDETYDILMGLPRTGEILSKLEKLFPRIVTDEAVRVEAVRAFRQLKELSLLRDNLVHYSGQAAIGHVLVRWKPHLVLKKTGFPYSIHDWSEMHGALADLKIIADFTTFHMVEKPKQAWLQKIWLQSVSLPDAWRYISPQLAQPGDKPRRKHPEQ